MASFLEKATRQHTKDHNSRLVLRTIYDYGEISRANLARLTQLTRTTVSDVVAELIERGLVQEIGHGPTAVGRTPILLGVVDDSRQVVAVNVANEDIHGALVNLRGSIRHRSTLRLPSRDGDAVLDAVYRVVDDLVRAATRPLLGIGINTPGLIDTSSGVVLRAVNFDWQDLPLRDLLQQRYSLPVYLANDSHTVALAEYMFGRSHDTPNLVVIKVGQGIGAGIILNGEVFYGDGYGAGEIGHVVVEPNGTVCKCGNRGCLETVASSGEVVRRARELFLADGDSALRRFAPDADSITVETVARALQAGDAGARRIVEKAGRSLAIAIANLVGVLNIRRIVVTGRIAPFGATLQDAIQAELARRALPALVRGTELEVVAQGPDTMMLGAAALLLTNELGLARLRRTPDGDGETVS